MGVTYIFFPAPGNPNFLPGRRQILNIWFSYLGIYHPVVVAVDIKTYLFLFGAWLSNYKNMLFVNSRTKITADGDCNHEIKRRLLLGRKVMTHLDSILKSRDITLPRKVRLVKAMVFPVVVYGCESWTVKKAESWRTDAFELWCWRRLVRVP